MYNYRVRKGVKLKIYLHAQSFITFTCLDIFFYRIRTAKCKLRVYNFYTTSFVCINWIFYHHQSLFSLSDFFYHYFVSSSLRSCIIVGRDFSKATSHFLLLLFVCSCIVVHTGEIRTKKNVRYIYILKSGQCTTLSSPWIHNTKCCLLTLLYHLTILQAIVEFFNFFSTLVPFTLPSHSSSEFF